MQTHKALLPFSENENFLQHIIKVYQDAGIQKVVVVRNADIFLEGPASSATPALVIVDNHFPERGRLYSIQLGLSCAPGAQYCFIHNIDNPFITGELICSLYDARAQADYVSPEYNSKGGHPILISARIIRNISRIKSYKDTLHEVLGMFARYKLPTSDENCLVNINFPSDYERYFSRKIAAAL